ncbi:hypothetical protein DYI95_003210 [Thermaerobacter sp. PB12/4term]|uniref:hypothetical protein n=1 Tax=Thermaerobacter sp. PB12/4term TaxID=2293838 RepID=UPI000E32738B|nr:hypothetical protein [Thermaerobacter sp. PB12/4term]QIA26666.1 hypothetical protein DYI95_003210 [Thermaerobacter sp. PB12/4term]
MGPSRVATATRGDPAARWGDPGQALLIALVALALVGVLAAVLSTLWARASTLAVRRAEAQTAFYAAEAGLAEGLQRVLAGDAAFLAGEAAMGQTGNGTYRVRLIAAGSTGGTGYTIESTGWAQARPASRRTVRMTVDSAFFRPVVAGDDLILDRDCLLCDPRLPIAFSPEALYADTLQGGDKAWGARQGSVPWPRLTYGALAAQVPNPTQVTRLTSRTCQLATSGWYEVQKHACQRLDVTAPWAGVTGDLDADHITVKPGAMLVVAGAVEVNTLAWVNAGAVTGGGIVVAGKEIAVDTVDLAQWGLQEAAILLALDTNTPDCPSSVPGCTYDPKRPDAARDPSNDITLRAFSLVNLSSARTLVAYAAPLRVPGPSGQPKLTVDLSSLVSFGLVTFRGTLVSGGDVELRDQGLVALSRWEVTADPAAARPLFELAGTLPGVGVLAQLEWAEQRGGGP